MDELGLPGTNKDPKVCRGTDRWGAGGPRVLSVGSQCSVVLRLDDSIQAWELPGFVILETPKVLGLMSWADLLPGQCSPPGGNPGSWWGSEQLAAEVDSQVSGSQGTVLCPMGISSFHSVH